MGLFESFLFGVLGQAIRALIGLKKKLAEANKSRKAFDSWFSLKFLLITLVLGGIAGIIGSMILSSLGLEISRLAIMVAGYSGADFIEGAFNSQIKKFFPKTV